MTPQHPPLGRLLTAIESDILPLTRRGVENGNKVFGGAVLDRHAGTVIAATNRETESPLWHGEMATLDAFFRQPSAKRPSPSECLFLSTHEPCSMCISAIVWCGFSTLYYLFSHEQTRDHFAIPHDLRILREIFACDAISQTNAFYTAHSIPSLIAAENAPDLKTRLNTIEKQYADLSAHYQQGKDGNAIPLP